MGFLKVIFFIIVGFYLFGLIGRLYLRYWIAKKQKEFEKTGQTGGFAFKQYSWGTGAQNHGTDSTARTKEGEIKVEQNSTSQKKVSKQVGDYVEYEEIKTEQNDN